MTVHVFATLQAKPEHEEAVETALKSLVSATREEPGSIRYDLFVPMEGELAFYLIESYADEAAFESHRSSEHYLDYRAKVADWLISTPRVTVLHPLDVAPHPL